MVLSRRNKGLDPESRLILFAMIVQKASALKPDHFSLTCAIKKINPDFTHSKKLSTRASRKLSSVLQSDMSAAVPLSYEPKPSRKTVLICDDEQDVLRAYKIALASKFNVLTAASGDDCLRSFSKLIESKGNIDVVVLDYRLGDALGDEVARKLQRIAPTKVVLLTAFDLEPSHISELKTENVISSFLKKPVSLASLIAAINELFGA
jgi:CheY-like chemotaxis protein